ncbi:tRNA(Ile)-lysidine synthase [Prevotella sp. tc2-28]|uniref:tRNA lysidine(34) synthetase TilS n=1 Tax=Prevotella sp. tc2-28 TaxID=1761888 RepID=UPI00089B95F7|nr:tRNA lysidine(34) synthetase TilS [Prevotella sp. tc2-28]SEA27254.1 tRNA(Ile)-lysidine synthase [Prevotella sp. tc2-28]
MWSKVGDYIKKHKLLNVNDLYLVALSGGADSVALLLLLKEAGYNVHAAHCNFHLRGAESDRDEAFCVEHCQQLGVELHRAHFDTREYAELHKVSIEMAARELRYKWFDQLRQDMGAAGICVAHHRDDSVETVLLNLVRGTGLRGLTGIQPRNGFILRPFLCVSRAEIEAFLSGRGQKYVTDSTNLEADALRNKVRLQVLPLLCELNPAVSENIQRTAENLVEAQKILDAISDNYKDSNILELSELEKYGSSEYVVFEWLKNYGFNGSQVHQILDADSGGIVSSASGYDVLKDRTRLIVEKTDVTYQAHRNVISMTSKRIVVPEEGTYILDENSKVKVRKCAVYVSKNPKIATLDADKVVFPLTIRRVEEGDWMVPYGMKGRKLLSDLMTGLKMNVFEKRRQLVVVDAQGVIVWVVGLRTDHRVAVGDQTKTVLEISFVTL